MSICKDIGVHQETLDKMHIANFVGDTLSTTEQSLLKISRALIANPEVLCIHKPTNGLDPAGIREIRETITGLGQRGVTVLLSSHILAEVQQVCDSVTIIVEGRILANGPMADVIGSETLESRFVELAGGTDAVEGMEWLQSFSD